MDTANADSDGNAQAIGHSLEHPMQFSLLKGFAHEGYEHGMHMKRRERRSDPVDLRGGHCDVLKPALPKRSINRTA
jgi:hypothetical protein